MSYKRMRVYTCDTCGKSRPAERCAPDGMIVEPSGWKHTGGRKGLTMCDECLQVLRADKEFLKAIRDGIFPQVG